jgi:hypothetical protein
MVLVFKPLVIRKEEEKDKEYSILLILIFKEVLISSWIIIIIRISDLL